MSFISELDLFNHRISTFLVMFFFYFIYEANSNQENMESIYIVSTLR